MTILSVSRQSAGTNGYEYILVGSSETTIKKTYGASAPTDKYMLRYSPSLRVLIILFKLVI